MLTIIKSHWHSVGQGTLVLFFQGVEMDLARRKSSLIVRVHPVQGETRIQLIAHYLGTVEET